MATTRKTITELAESSWNKLYRKYPDFNPIHKKNEARCNNIDMRPSQQFCNLERLQRSHSRVDKSI